MKKLFRWLSGLLLGLVALVVVLLLAKDALLRELLQWRIRRDTGLAVRIGRFEVGLLTPTVAIEGFRLDNPPEFGGGTFIDVPELRVEYDLAAIRRHELHFRSVRLHLGEFNYVRKLDGGSNLEELLRRPKAPPPEVPPPADTTPETPSPNPAPAQPAPPPAPAPEPKPAPREARPAKPARTELSFTGIDTLNLTLGEFRSSVVNHPDMTEAVNFGITNRVLTNVLSASDLAPLIGEIFLKGPTSPKPAKNGPAL